MASNVSISRLLICFFLFTITLLFPPLVALVERNLSGNLNMTKFSTSHPKVKSCLNHPGHPGSSGMNKC
ncbi:hypothetical protein Patl1_23490 [Pistacia atlantica]|uniref:Uncharacterized protein n=1 Tax=Pistacia atlantica TaxID=434234 RepID=A0ACC1A142_9ROSI|nr:hypothetical protein Patl1_23490 [Pistacia atlantica]